MGLRFNAVRRRAPELYFFFYNASIVFILPYLAILWRQEGFSGGQIGILSAVRPFICSISGQLLVGVADARSLHFAISIATYVITLSARSSMALVHGFIAHLFMIICSESCQSPFSIMTDAAIAASTDEKGYTTRRVWASLGWGALAPLSGWIVGMYGVPHSIAVYFALVTVALIPTLLLPLRELGRKRASQANEVQGAARPLGSKTGPGALGRSSAVLLLSAGDSSSSGDLDSRQHGCHAAELAIELTDSVPDGEEGMGAAAGGLTVRILEKAAKAEAASSAAEHGVVLRPLLTTADEDAAEEAAATARAAEAAARAAAAEQDDSWSISARSTPKVPRGAGLPPSVTIPVPQSSASDALMSPQGRGGTPAGSYNGMPITFTPASLGSNGGALARTTSAATTAFYSVRSGPSVTNLNGMLSPPRGGAGESGGRPPVFRQPSDVASPAASTAYSPAVSALGQLPLQQQAAVAAGRAGALLRQSSLQRQASLQHQPSLVKQLSNMSQALNGFDQSILEGSISDGTFMTPRGAVTPRGISFQQAAQGEGSMHSGAAGSRELLGLPEVRTVHPPHFSESSLALASQPDSSGHDRQLRRRNSSRRLLPPPGIQETVKASPLPPLPHGALPAAGKVGVRTPLLSSKESLDGTLPEVAISFGAAPLGDMDRLAIGSGCSSGGMGLAGAGLGAKPQDLSVWAGVKHMLSNPHHTAFFATTLLMGLGYGVLGYTNLYIKESGGSGLLIGMMLLVNTCGEMPLFATSGWWLPKLGHEVAFNIGMAGWVLRLGLYTLIPLFPSMWCVLPVELLQGLTFAVAYGVGTVHAKSIAPLHLRSTTQSMFFGLYYGIGPGISGLAGGFIYQSMGMRFVFVIFSCVLVVGWLCILLALRLATRKERTQKAMAEDLAP